MHAGVLYAFLAYTSWGLFPLYFKHLAAVTFLTGLSLLAGGIPASARSNPSTGFVRREGSQLLRDGTIITSPDGRHHVLIVVFTKGGKTSTMSQRERAVASITRTVYRDFVGWSPFRRARR